MGRVIGLLYITRATPDHKGISHFLKKGISHKNKKDKTEVADVAICLGG
jgi:hypothetical protein